MKQLYIYFLIAGFIMMSCRQNDPEPIPQNLIYNSDLESPDSLGWINDGNGYTGDFEAVFTDEDANSASHSLKISRSISMYNDGYYWYWTQSYTGRMPVKERLNLTVRIKTVDITGEGIAIALRQDSVSKPMYFQSTQDRLHIYGTTEWTKYTLSMTTCLSQTTKINVYLLFLPGTTGTVYFDDITLGYGKR